MRCALPTQGIAHEEHNNQPAYSQFDLLSASGSLDMSGLTPKHVEDAARIFRGLLLVLGKAAADRYARDEGRSVNGATTRPEGIRLSHMNGQEHTWGPIVMVPGCCCCCSCC